ncbi:MAG: PqqD family protein [Anaerolineales bacterium]
MTISVATRFLRNPDVALREEDPDEGALLFNPDTNQVKVINATGWFIWQQCGVARTLDEIVAEVQKGFDEVPSGQVTQDVHRFVDEMVASGFIGIVEATKE